MLIFTVMSWYNCDFENKLILQISTLVLFYISLFCKGSSVGFKFHDSRQPPPLIQFREISLAPMQGIFPYNSQIVKSFPCKILLHKTSNFSIVLFKNDKKYINSIKLLKILKEIYTWNMFWRLLYFCNISHMITTKFRRHGSVVLQWLS